MDTFSLTLVIIGALNWLLVALAQFDLVAWIFGSPMSIWARLVYGLIGLCGLWCIKLLFTHRREPNR
jgi:uncharacterized membrane protein YuzA (DUF378 family)